MILDILHHLTISRYNQHSLSYIQKYLLSLLIVCSKLKLSRSIMFRWLKNRRNVSSADYCENSSTSDYRYGFLPVSKKQKPTTVTNQQPKSPYQSTASSEHIYEEIDDQIPSATVKPYSITSLEYLIDHQPSEPVLSTVYFASADQAGVSSDSGFSKRNSSSDDTDSTTSSTYQPISLQPPHSTNQLSKQRKRKSIKINQIKSKASSIIKARRCRRWLSNHFINKPRADSSDEEFKPIPVTRQRRFESTRQFTRRRLALKKIEDNWFDSDDDSSVCSEDSNFSQMDISDFNHEPSTLTDSDNIIRDEEPLKPTLCENPEDIDSDSGRSSLPKSLPSSNSLFGEMTDEDPFSDIDVEDLPTFNPKTGFGLNRWYRQ